MIQALLTSEVQQFINDHLLSDPATLMLKASKYPNWPMREIVTQIQSKSKAKKKLPTWFKTEGILYPPTLSLEQCSSEETANYKASLVKPGQRMVDLTGGFGVDFAALSNHFETSHYVEKQSLLVDIAKHNFERLNLNQVEYHEQDSDQFLAGDTCFDLIYIDPARRDNANKKVFRLEDCEPNVVDNLSMLMSKSAQVMIKTSPLLDIKGALRSLKCVSDVHIVSVNNEVKELIFLLSSNASKNSSIHCVDLKNSGVSRYGFTYDEEEALDLDFGDMLNYLYEPNASILKAGAFKSIAKSYGVTKLNPNSHLYTSDRLITNFPGRAFEVIDKISLNKKSLKNLIPTMMANITVRNYPMSVDQIRKKTGLKEGGENYLFATSDQTGPKVFLTKKAV